MSPPDAPSMDDATRKVRKVWEDQADSWYAQRESLLSDSRPVHEWLVEHVGARSGQRILEIAAGPGDTGFLAAKKLGDGGRLVSTDIAPGMVDAARKRGAELGIENAEYRVLDAQAMDLPDESFDGAICRWGLMLMPDPTAAFREARRVLKPGGRLAFAVFTGPQDNPWVRIPVSVLRAAGKLPQPSAEWQPGILALGDRDRLQSHLDASGFSSTKIEPVDFAWTFTDPAGYWTFLVEVTALGPIFRALSDDERTKIRGEIDAELAEFTHAGGIALPARCWCGVATR